MEPGAPSAWFSRGRGLRAASGLGHLHVRRASARTPGAAWLSYLGSTHPDGNASVCVEELARRLCLISVGRGFDQATTKIGRDIAQYEGESCFSLADK